MSQQEAQLNHATHTAAPAKPARSFVVHAKLISLLTLASRLLGLVREGFAAHYFGPGMITSAFTLAFTIPNLFRRLFGEGALSAAFIPLYSQSLKTQDTQDAQRFAAASVNLLIVILTTLTLVGELLLWLSTKLWTLPEDRLLAVKLTAIMLPYVLLICGTAFLGAILQVHRRFGLVAAAPIVLNIALIVSTILGAKLYNISTLAGQKSAIYLVAGAVLLAGIGQLLLLIPSLRAVGFQFQWTRFWTPTVRHMLKLSLPVAFGAGVLQLSVLIDRGMSFFLAQGINDQGQLVTHFSLLGHTIRYPMQFGAAARLAWAQYLYQFPLGVFAIALATAIFPALSADAMDADRQRFRAGLLRGIQVTLWEGFACSVGLMLVAQLAVQVLFERGQFTADDTQLVAQSLRFYSIAIWAFSLQQIINRAYYALHDTLTPLIMSIVALIVEMAIKLPLLWTPLGESGMAIGTAVSYTLQSLIMLVLLQRKTGSLGLSQLSGFICKLAIATALMALACWLVQKAPFYPTGPARHAALLRLIILVGTGAAIYLGACLALGIDIMQHMLPKRFRSERSAEIVR